MSFTITIEETREVVEVRGAEWETIDTEEVELAHSPLSDDRPLTRIKEVYGYTPEIEKRVKTTTTILEQEVDELNLTDVICAINGIQQ